MNAPNRPTNLAGPERIEVRRLIDAPRERVFRMWADAEQMGKWMTDGGPVTLDVRPGGRFRIDMNYKGKIYDHEGEYLEVTPPSRIVFTWISDGTNRKPTIVTVELHDRAGRTELVLTHEGLPDAANAESHREGWAEIVAMLEKVMIGLLIAKEIAQGEKQEAPAR